MIEPFYVDTGLDSTFNKILTEELQFTGKWKISPDQYYHNYEELNDHSDTGMIIVSFSKERDPSLNLEYCKINTYGEIIGKIILRNQKVLQIKNLEVERILWNYYNKGSTGVYHRDISLDKEDQYLSAVYYLNDCDGGTIVEGVKYNCKPGHALIFDSKNQHKGFGPFNSKNKFCVNFIYRVQIENDMV